MEIDLYTSCTTGCRVSAFASIRKMDEQVRWEANDAIANCDIQNFFVVSAPHVRSVLSFTRAWPSSQRNSFGFSSLLRHFRPNPDSFTRFAKSIIPTHFLLPSIKRTVVRWSRTTHRNGEWCLIAWFGRCRGTARCIIELVKLASAVKDQSTFSSCFVRTVDCGLRAAEVYMTT